MTPAALEWVARFRRYMSTERRLSPHTDSNYARDLRAFVKYCEKAQIDQWGAVDSQHVRAFAAQSHSRGLSPRSIQRRLSAVRSFYEFLIKQDKDKQDKPEERSGVTRNPAVDVRAPKAAKRLPETLDPDQMARLLEIPAGDSLTTRDRAIMELLYSSGLRLSELVGLDVVELHMADRTVTVLGKGSKERSVPVGRVAIEALKKWLEERAALVKPGEAALFVSRRGRRLGPRAVQKLVAQWAVRQGLSMHVYPHLFRHSFATHLLESSRELRGVQELLGHASISTTQVYTHLDFQHLARIYEASHPRARMRKKG
jgi:integrase/recombinase XerC